MTTRDAQRQIDRSLRLEEKIEDEIARHAATLEDLKAERAMAWFRANRAGATYTEIMDATGRSAGLVAREIGAAKMRVPVAERALPSRRRAA